ncbi:hypothetical protein RYX36_037204 [Vicia faba]
MALFCAISVSYTVVMILQSYLIKTRKKSTNVNIVMDVKELLPRGLINSGNLCFLSETVHDLLVCSPFVQLLQELRTCNIPKNSITVADCYLYPNPSSRGSRVLTCSFGQQEFYVINVSGKFIEDGKSYANHLVLDSSDIHFLNVNHESVLEEAKRETDRFCSLSVNFTEYEAISAKGNTKMKEKTTSYFHYVS